jgi:RNA polymerase sigma factor (sigma-70 family)
MGGGAARGSEVRQVGRDPVAFEAFYRRHVDAVNRFVVRRVTDPYTAADLTAEVFLAAITSARSGQVFSGDPLAWLYGVARNVVAAEQRRGGREQRAIGRLAGRRLLDDDALAELETRIAAEDEARRLYQGMDHLPAGERAVLELVAVDGLPVKDAAALLGIRPATARVRLHRARRSMQDALHRAGPAPAADVDDVARGSHR